MVMASEVKFDLGIELSDLNYPDIHVYIASNEHFGGLGGHGSDLKCLTSISNVPMSLWPLTVTIHWISLSTRDMGLDQIRAISDLRCKWHCNRPWPESWRGTSSPSPPPSTPRYNKFFTLYPIDFTVGRWGTS